ncbi:DNA polymerase [Corynebacterium coyleae]|uniref:DNA polymerase n=1 Tax=Corynebacterium coyleae TaxID=53374 RepID=UPI001CCC2C16|nr:DNA polymerase [Corynebacterium coyleae]UBI09996.1 DNA polymerase [Corynebacterium coyleae]
MFEITQAVRGRTATIQVVETRDELEAVWEWLEKNQGETFAVDTETTGLDIFSDGFKVRTIQIGVRLEAWVIPVIETDFCKGDVERLLLDRDLTLHNATYDLLAIRRFFGVSLDWKKVTDTKILASLGDPRSTREGGRGKSLEDLTRALIDPEVADTVKSSMSTLSKETGLKKNELFASIDTFHETYLRYAGMDVVLTWALFNVLSDEIEDTTKRIPEFNPGLVRYEHEVSRVCAEMEWNGFKVDVPYAESLSASLKEEQELWERLAEDEYGVGSVNSTVQVAAAILDNGYRLNELTASGKYKVDKKVLEGLSEQGFLLADYVTAAKSAKKRRMSWVEKFLDGRDSDDKVHANIQTLAARTARMSITGIPAQTLPSGDWEIRRCFIPEDGNVIVACDYQAQELRVLAALSGDENMRRAFAEDADLHQITADASGVERRVGKTVNFAYVYGSGAGNIAETCNISVSKAKEVIQGFERTYPGVKKLSQRLQREAKSKGRIVTPTGRVLPVDPERPYAALNYMIQSTSRDITASALLRLDEEGFTPYLRLPIHDEVVAEVPEKFAEQGALRIAEIMSCEFRGVNIGSDHEIYGKSWGGGYVDQEDEEDVKKYESTFTG